MEVDKSKCLICEVTCHQKELTLFRFPEEESRLKMWIKEISPLLDILKIHSNNLKENGRICSRHFREKDFINCKQNSLVQNACPSLSVSNLSINFSKRNEGSDVVLEEKEIMDSSQLNDASEKDTFQCGRCKSQYQILSEFMDHKRYQCQSTVSNQTKTTMQKTKPFHLGTLLPLQNVLLDTFNDNLPQQDTKATPESPPDKILSLVINNKLDVTDSVAALPTQMVFTPHLPLTYNGVLRLTESNPADLSLPTQFMVSPQPTVNSPLWLNHDNDPQLSSLIITADAGDCFNGGIVYTCPVQGSDGMVITSSSAVDQVILTEEAVDGSKAGKSGGDAVTYCELSSADHASREGLEQSGNELEGREKEVERRKTRLPCSFCGKVFEKPFNLQQHERVHTGERPFQCIVCGRAFTQKSNVRKHMMRHKVWPKGKQTLKLRVSNTGGCNGELMDGMEYCCQYCSLSFKSYAEHKKHLAVHSNIKVYRCIQKDCNETFRDLDEFLAHSKMHSSVEFRCHICFKVFTNLEDLGVHQYDHDTSAKERRKDLGIKLKCKVCHARFKTAESLKNHLAVDSHHYQCIHCSSVFSSERFLRRHLFIHMDSSQSKFKCQNCKKTFRTQQNLRNHMFIHLKEKPFTCDHCDKQFASKYRLKRHLAIHLDQYLECPFKKHLGCDKTFYRKDKLRDHVNTHSHCKLRSCRICSKMYWTLSKLHQHMRRDHKAGRKVLKCFACSQTFRKAKQLSQHHCTVEERKPKRRERSGEKEGSETVSNIEIIMVPLGANGRTLT